MKWSKPYPTDKLSGFTFYHYILCETPFGIIRIEYKNGWWSAGSPCLVTLNGELLFDRYDIEDSKREVLYWMRNKSIEINNYLETLKHIY